ncbi:MAG: hypothetical protein U5R06_08420 [candidate division KSB1 bacterium]|nr:hypothetical protein [candidate division KSB1 bacterium]
MQARLTEQPSEQHKLQVQVRQMEKRKRELRQRLFQSEDDIG